VRGVRGRGNIRPRGQSGHSSRGEPEKRKQRGQEKTKQRAESQGDFYNESGENEVISCPTIVILGPNNVISQLPHFTAISILENSPPPQHSIKL
jgi:hypothetical protein